MSIERDITEFRQAFGLPINEKPALLSGEDMELHIRLVGEELNELILAWAEGDLTEVFDGIVDMMYVLGGLAVHMGLPLEEGWREVHTSNMSKLDENGEAIYREDGKVLKSDRYFPPRLDVILEMATRGVEWLEAEEAVERP